MNITIKRWGDDLAIKLPDSMVEKLSLKEGSYLNSEPFERLFLKHQIKTKSNPTDPA